MGRLKHYAGFLGNAAGLMSCFELGLHNFIGFNIFAGVGGV